MSILRTAPRLRKVYPAVAVEAYWCEYPSTVLPRFSRGATCGLVLGRGDALTLYFVRPVLDGGRIVAWDMVNSDNAKEYRLPADCSACCCGDATFRTRLDHLCKHAKSLAAALLKANDAILAEAI